VLDNSALPHLPCGPSCDLKTTISTWQAVPQSVKQSAATWVKDNFRDQVWHLHSAVSTVKDGRNLRKAFQRLILGTVVHGDMSGTLLVFSSTSDITGAEATSGPLPTIKPVSKDTAAPIPDMEKAPIRFKDAVGRKFSFPWHICKTWKGMEGLIRQAFLHVDIIGQHVKEGHYDLMGPDGEIILPQVWDAMIQPDWEISMHMWPIPEPKPMGQMERPMPEVLFDQTGDPFAQDNTRAGPSVHDPYYDPDSNLDMNAFMPMEHAKTSRRPAKKKDKSRSAKVVDVPPPPTLFSGDPFLEPLPPMNYREEQRQRASRVPEADSNPAHRGAMRPQQGVPRVEFVDEMTRQPLRSKQKKKLSTFAGWTVDHQPKPSKRHDQYSYASSWSSFGSGESFTSCDPGPDEILQEASDVEDAMLNDEQLKSKMMKKYAGGAMTSTAPVTAPDVSPRVSF
jgi:hypothetical protein